MGGPEGTDARQRETRQTGMTPRGHPSGSIFEYGRCHQGVQQSGGSCALI